MKRILSAVMIGILIITLIAVPAYASATKRPFAGKPLPPKIADIFGDYRHIRGEIADMDKHNNILTLNISNHRLPAESTFQRNREIELTYREDAPFFDGVEYNDIEDVKIGEYVYLTVFDSQIVFAGTDKQKVILPQKEVGLEAADLDDVPDIVAKELEEIRKGGGYKAIKIGNVCYLLAASGEKNTGGYSIKIYGARSSEDGNIDVFVTETQPRPGDMVTQALTYPYDIKVIKPSENVNAIRFLDSRGKVLKVIDV